MLSALLVMFASKTMLDIVYTEHKPEKPGWALPITEVAPTAAKEPAAPFDAKQGASPCCPRPAPKRPGHLQEMPVLPHAAEGRPERHGPQPVGHRRPQARARTPGFPYSEAMKNKGGDWT